ncbi:MAG: hypothetical protein JXA77_10675 [Bacteroidales bacterium]|nr:hypothetical protein [Bacteroidales bacterium]MBN2820539.1 hypothetical protein [Bacteroidales bacterium]
MNQFAKYILSVFVAVFLAQSLVCQTTLNVVSKKTVQEFPFKKEDILIIRAEKGVIDIKPWQNNKVKLEMNIVVKNENLNIAKMELDYVSWNSNQKINVLQLNNKINIPNNGELKSIIRVEYLLWLPQGAKLSINNSFGQVKITNLSFSGQIDIQYCDLILDKTHGFVEVSSNVGDLNISESGGSYNITSKYSTVNINKPSGNYKLESTYGNVKTTIDQDFSTLNIISERCDVTILNKNCIETDFKLEAKYSTIKLNESCYIKKKSILEKKTSGTHPNETNTFKYSLPESSHSILIKSSYGAINME